MQPSRLEKKKKKLDRGDGARGMMSQWRTRGHRFDEARWIYDSEEGFRWRKLKGPMGWQNHRDSQGASWNRWVHMFARTYLSGRGGYHEIFGIPRSKHSNPASKPGGTGRT